MTDTETTTASHPHGLAVLMPFLEPEERTQWRVSYQSNGRTKVTAPMDLMYVAHVLWQHRTYDGLSVVEETVVTTRREIDPAEFVPGIRDYKESRP